MIIIIGLTNPLIVQDRREGNCCTGSADPVKNEPRER